MNRFHLPFLAGLALAAPQRQDSGLSCKCYRGDDCWPSPSHWEFLNHTVGGTLRKVIPPAASCYNEFDGMQTYDREACEAATAGFLSGDWMINSGVAPIGPYPTNETCLPTTHPGDTCLIGYLPEYVIMAETLEHIKTGVDFARDRNLRLIIRNTGHDFMGRSVGAGALAINTHSFKGAEFTDKYNGPGDYTGGAVTLAAGIQGIEVYTQANQQNPPVEVVGGFCGTVGFAGGYIQGGGHGPLSTIHGMAADHVLSVDLITASGEYVTANADNNPDLFWALKGGGPSTFGVVTSITVKTFLEQKSSGMVLSINSTHTNDTELFWRAVDAFHGLANHYVDNGMFGYYELSELNLHVQPLMAPRMTAAELNKALEPLFEKLEKLNVPYTTYTKEYDTFFNLYKDLLYDIEENHDELIKAFRTATTIPGWQEPGVMFGHIVGPGVGNPNPDNAIHPGWRNASSFSISSAFLPLGASKDLMAAGRSTITNIVDAALIKASPRGGSYVNEGDIEQPGWQSAYWGDNYPRLLEVRKKWDPEGVFYAKAMVGTEDWVEVNDPPRLRRKTV
ncbi:unnamed protein product [Clonostachys rhizophaga]|uniref:FAD-binding PCMH-type domain-containing protein n=1 Tax=Clonostachys rhizophaga TaxID=160324 RepID=A0A9N9VFX0_9HYPO|nr:unnamed protein product [Clonostachys rhizophaga]